VRGGGNAALRCVCTLCQRKMDGDGTTYKGMGEEGGKKSGKLWRHEKNAVPSHQSRAPKWKIGGAKSARGSGRGKISVRAPGKEKATLYGGGRSAVLDSHAKRKRRYRKLKSA